VCGGDYPFGRSSTPFLADRQSLKAYDCLSDVLVLPTEFYKNFLEIHGDNTQPTRCTSRANIGFLSTSYVAPLSRVPFRSSSNGFRLVTPLVSAFRG